MAIYSFRQSVISGGGGQSAVAAAAYRHSARMEHEQSSRIENYSRKTGTIHSELALPAAAPRWILERLGAADVDLAAFQHRFEGRAAVSASEALWNAVENGEKRRDARYASELVLALPSELTREENIVLVRAFVEENYTSRGRIADWAYHLPEGREHNPHVHILSTVRPLAEHGFGPKATIARDGAGEPVRTLAGDVVYEKWSGSKAELLQMRASWAAEVNQALHRAGYDITVDHRSFADRGITEIEPTIHRGKTQHMRDIPAGHEVPAFDAADRAANFETFRLNPSLVLEHITREQSTFDTRDIARTIHRYAGRGDDFRSLLAHVGILPELVTIQAQMHDPESNRVVQRERFTTVAVLEREALLHERVHARFADRSHHVDPDCRIEACRRSEAEQGFAYTPEQHAAIERLTRDEGVAVMVGIAGAGKSTVMRAVGEIYRGEDVGVFGAALAGKAADNLQQSSGIASRTLASWEHAWTRGFDPLERGDVFVIDEAGMVASAQMRRVMDHLDGFGAKVILVGDARQLQPIEAGAAFRSIAQEIGYVELTEVRRQEREDHAHASVLFGAGRTRSALDIYRGNDTFRFHDVRDAALSAAIDGWRHDWRTGSDVVMLAHTNRDVQALNVMAREAIQAEGGLVDGQRFVTARGVREFAVGDRVILLENDRRLGVRNGTIGTVETVAHDRLRVTVPGHDEAVTIERDAYNNIDYGYATTIHKAQGSTHDRVHVVAGGMMDAQLTYVALSRHREEVTMHVPLDVFTRPRQDRFSTPDHVLDRLALDRLKDTSLDYGHTQDYAEARQALEAHRAYEQSLAGRFDAFLEQRGLAHPSDVLQSVREFAAEVLARARRIPAEAMIRVPEGVPAHDRISPVRLDTSDALRQALNRLDHVQCHSAAMSHEEQARRLAFFTAENELTRGRTAEPLRVYAEAVAAVVAPSLVVAIGRDGPDIREEPRLSHLPRSTLATLHANWRDIHAVSRAAWELGLLETARSIDTSYRQDREERTLHAEYERTVDQLLRIPDPVRSEPVRGIEPSPLPEVARLSESVPDPGSARLVIPAVTVWPVGLDETVARAVARSPDVAAFSDHVQRIAARIWRNPEAAWTEARSEIDAAPREARAVIDRMSREPQTFGELLGGRTLFLRPDAERQAAIEQLPSLASMTRQYVGAMRLSEPVLRQREIEWRSAMERPLPSLSQDARSVLDDLNRAHSLRSPATLEQTHELSVKAMGNKPAWEELQSWTKDLAARLTVPDALERFPSLSREDRSSIAHLIEHVTVAERQAGSTRSIEHSRDQQREYERVPERDRGHEYGR